MLTCRVEIEADARGTLTFATEIVPQRKFSTNRAGLVVLHPLEGVAGELFEVTATDGSVSEIRLPFDVSPAQPMRNISRLRHRVKDVTVEIDFEGATFEMEDQRNWTDASFKTYCPLLSDLHPYDLSPGSVVRQRVAIALRRTEPVPILVSATERPRSGAPEIVLALEPEWDRLPEVTLAGVRGLLLRIGEGHDWREERLAAVARQASSAGMSLDVEIVLPDEEDIGHALSRHAALLARAGIAPAHVTALSRAYLRSYQPDGDWPEGPGPYAPVPALRRYFPGAGVGAGMLTYFAELNRARPPTGLGDFVTHGTSAIVHACDDRSVLQTLEALPDVFRSARHIAGRRSVRLGLCAIGMRTNPYGADVVPNPDRGRVAMAREDPRQDEPFAAAFAVGIYAAAAAAGVESVALAAPAGPFGAVSDVGELRPIARAIGELGRFAGRSLAEPPKLPTGVVAVGDGEHWIIANASMEARCVTWPEPIDLQSIDGCGEAVLARPAAPANESSADATSFELGSLAVALVHGRR